MNRLLITGMIIGMIVILGGCDNENGKITSQNLATDNEQHLWYSAEIKLPYDKMSLAQIVSLFNTLQKKGYFAYRLWYAPENATTAKESAAESKCKLYAGLYKNQGQIENFMRLLKEKEGFDCSAVEPEIDYMPYKDTEKCVVISNESIIWVKEETFDNFIKIYELNKEGREDFVHPSWSADGKRILFYWDNKIQEIESDGKSLKILAEVVGGIGAFQEYSPDGKYIAYLGDFDWESISNLWVMKSDGSEKRKLTDLQNGQNDCIKSFEWHPDSSKLFFIEGHAFGTVSKGGNMYAIDINGKNKRNVVIADAGTEISTGFYIKDNKIYYSIINWDSEYTNATYIDKVLELTDIK